MPMIWYLRDLTSRAVSYTHLGYHVVGIDLSSDMIKEARKKIIPGFEPYVGDMRVPFLEASSCGAVAVSYTHLDVYKRQIQAYAFIQRYGRALCCRCITLLTQRYQGRKEYSS